jgi:hypothetical protein
LTELDGLIPWEREIYVVMLIDHLKDVEDQRKQQKK